MSTKNGHTDLGRGAQFKEETVRRNNTPTGTRGTLAGRMDVSHTVEAVVAAGGYMSFGQTSDGGALLIRVLMGATKLESYCHTDLEIAEALLYLKTRYTKKDTMG